jgi:hypothetical protein
MNEQSGIVVFSLAELVGIRVVCLACKTTVEMSAERLAIYSGQSNFFNCPGCAGKLKLDNGKNHAAMIAQELEALAGTGLPSTIAFAFRRAPHEHSSQSAG